LVVVAGGLCACRRRRARAEWPRGRRRAGHCPVVAIARQFWARVVVVAQGLCARIVGAVDLCLRRRAVRADVFAQGL